MYLVNIKQTFSSVELNKLLLLQRVCRKMGEKLEKVTLWDTLDVEI